MEILPNWHPILVHFSVALVLVAALLQLTAWALPSGSLRTQCVTVARWNLWLGAGFAVLTVAAGFFAYNSVTHDTPSHLAMIEHKNWALVTLPVLLLVAGYSFYTRARPERVVGAAVGVLLAAGLVIATAWHGAELVYHYGLGVQSLPKPESHEHAAGHAHEHGSAESLHEPEASHDHDSENMHAEEHAEPTEASPPAADTAVTPTPVEEQKGVVHQHKDGSNHEHKP